MQRICQACGASFPDLVVFDGIRLNLHGRKRCLDCLPHRPQRKPRKAVVRPVAVKLCESCGNTFRAKVEIDAKIRSLYRRRFCLDCSPFGIHNTSKSPPGIKAPEALREHRRKRRNAKTYRHQKKKRKQIKAELIEARGGRCEDCGYVGVPAVLEFHHRDASTKDFAIGSFAGSKARLLAEADKCDLLCANCHRIRHVARADDPHAVVEFRRRTKLRAIEWFGGICDGCDRGFPPAVMEFHHRDPNEKDFAISNNGIPRPWERIVAELAKCVMLCANCHREVHAGVRQMVEPLLGLAEEPGIYAA